jgi:hypothetical protein
MDAPLLTGGKVYTQAYTLSVYAKTALLKNIVGPCFSSRRFFVCD